MIQDISAKTRSYQIKQPLEYKIPDSKKAQNNFNHNSVGDHSFY